MRQEGWQQARPRLRMQQGRQPAAAAQREAAPASSLFLVVARCAFACACCHEQRVHDSACMAQCLLGFRPSPARVLPSLALLSQYTEPLEVEDLEAKGWRKFDGTRQYAHDKRRQVRTREEARVSNG